jgi:high affinity Mn2+ porin
MAAVFLWTIAAEDSSRAAESRAVPRRAASEPASYNWSGLYLGGHIGEGFGRLHGGTNAGQPLPLPGVPLQGLIGGYQLGYNVHLPNNVVVGIEADATFGSFSGMPHDPSLGINHYVGTLDYFGTVRPRVGYAYGRFLPYVTGGLAWGVNKVAVERDGEEHGLTRTHWGWTVGAGIEYAVDGHWTLRGEYLYVDFNRQHYGALFFGDPGASFVPFAPSVSAFKLGLNYRFDDGEPARAPSGKMVVKAPAPWTPDDWSVHVQTTYIQQGYPSFRSPYQGENSLFGGAQTRNTWSVTGYLGRRLWEGGELYINPELAQGSGLSDTLGLAGFANGEAQKAGFPVPHPNFARAFLRQTFGLGGEQEKVEDGLNTIAGKRDVSRLTFTVGKLSVGDIFDDNTYSHDPRTTFLNWTIWSAGAFDYPADQVGYTWGAVADLNQKSWALRAGYFMVPRVSNVNQFDGHIAERASSIIELETRYQLFSQPGKLRLIGFLNRTNSGSYRETLDNPAFGVDIALTRRTRSKYGYVVNVEQAINDDLGVFGRWSWNNGKTEIMSFTDVDASLSGGAVLKGARWGRPDDKIGLAGVVNALSNDHRDFIAAGGLGPLIGDGRLNYQTERVIEAFYALNLRKDMALTFDYQFVTNPAYNADRGPVSIFAARFHAEY